MDRFDAMINQSETASAWLADAPRALAARIDKGRLVLELSTGVVVSLPWSKTHLGKQIPSTAEILGGGLDIYFYELDEALFVPDLLADIAHLKQAA